MKEEVRPVIRLRQNFLMILMFLLDRVDLLHRQVNLAYHQDGLQLQSPAGDRERVGPGNASRERLPLRPSSPEPPIHDDDDDQPPQEERQRGRSRSRERVHPHAQVPKEPQTQHVVTPETDDVSDEDF